MLLECVLIDAFLVSSVVSLALCANGANRGESVAFISELIVQCKQRVETRFIPWASVAAFACLVFVQMWWMHGVSAAWLQASAGTENYAKKAKRAENEKKEANESNNGRHTFVLFAAVAVLGFCGVVYFDCNGSTVDRMGHRVGVAALALGTFVALHLVWVNLRTVATNERLCDEALLDDTLVDVPCVTWVEYDVLWVCVLSVFIVTGLLENNYIVSVRVRGVCDAVCADDVVVSGMFGAAAGAVHGQGERHGLFVRQAARVSAGGVLRGGRACVCVGNADVS
jgi:hypothetical protein